jgi:hypothetical protein
MHNLLVMFFAFLIISSLSIIQKSFGDLVVKWDECIPHGKAIFNRTPPNNESPLDPTAINANSQNAIVYIEASGPDGTVTGSADIF